ncbi:hypothetical protein MMC34_008441 [Xylographa carneopallida]|nr:hypothetical protein [Xylographa carneopallida]
MLSSMLLVVLASLVCLCAGDLLPSLSSAALPVTCTPHLTTPPASTYPIQQRLALTPQGMSVSWSTVGPLPTGVQPSVRYGTSPSKLTMTATGYTLHYEPSITYFHHVLLTNVQYKVEYYWLPVYGNASSIKSFSGQLEPGCVKPFTVAINGDMGIVNEDNTVAALARWTDRIDLYWHVGDLNYADDSFLYCETYETATEQWMNTMTPIFSKRPYMMCPGNHDITCNEEVPALCPTGQRNVTSYLQRYRMPYAESGAVNNMYFSFDYGLVHFISIDTEVNNAAGPEGPGTLLNAGPFGNQLAWLQADLKKAATNRAKVPWIFVAGHRPFFTSNTDNKLSAAQAIFEPLFLQYGVDAVFFGHVHWYERMYPIRNGTATQFNYNNPTAPIYFLPASAGNVEGLDSGSITQNYTAFLDTTHYGFGLMHIQNATHMNWTFYESATLQILDQVQINKKSHVTVKK